MNTSTLKPRFAIVLLAAFVLVIAGLSTRTQVSASPAVPDNPVVVRVYYATRENLDSLASRLDIWEVNHQQAYLLALVSPDEYTQLAQAGYRLEIDPARTAELTQPHALLPGQGPDSIPGYPCYRTVEETYTALQNLAMNNPDLGTWMDIGDSWEKFTPGGLTGYDINALELTNKNSSNPKSTFFLMAEIHAREYVTAETAARFAEYLVSNYGIDPDITWLLDYNKIYIVAMTNPDGRKKAETGVWWRKNTDSDDGCSDSSNWGTDLNRNNSFHWGGDSNYACAETYQGPSAGSEPETQAIQNFILSLFPDQRGPLDTDPAPIDTTGAMVTLHSYQQLVLWPWGWTSTHAPNSTQLQTLGRKLAYFNNYTPQQSYSLYMTTGTSDDYAYGELGIAAYTFEMGTQFFQDCTSFENTIYPNNRNALLYAFKAARHPYMTPSGPDSISVTATPNNVQPGTSVLLHAVANDTRYRSGEPTQNISGTHYTLNTPDWITGTVTTAMTADDGAFNEKIEDVSATIDTSCMAPGKHTLFVESEDVNNNWGVPGAAFLTIGTAHGVSLTPETAAQNAEAGQIVAYPMTVDNLGNTTDTFTVTITSQWTTTGPLEISGLAACGTTSFTVTVQVPADATIGAGDVTTVVVTSHTDPAQSKTALLTTQIIGTPPTITPLSQAQTGNPGEAVLYNISVTNANPIADTFDVHVNSGWDVDAPATLGPLDALGNATLAVTVSVPLTAPAGLVDVASVQIASQNPGVQPVTAQLTTTANPLYSMALEAPTLQQLTQPGQVVTYTIYLTNTGNVTDTYDLSVTHVWETVFPPAVGPLAPGQSAKIEVLVTVPAGAAWGSVDTATVTITSQGETTLTRAYNLVTSLYSRVYLAIMRK